MAEQGTGILRGSTEMQKTSRSGDGLSISVQWEVQVPVFASVPMELMRHGKAGTAAVDHERDGIIRVMDIKA